MTDITINRGSDWHKWDLHLHSCYSIINNNFPHDNTGKPIESKFIEKIESSGLSAVGLTNYFRFRDEDFALKNKLNDSGIKTFLNLEIRLDNLNHEKQNFDFHIIFSDRLEDEIIKNFLNNLNVKVGSKVKKASQLTSEEIKTSAQIPLNELLIKIEEESSQIGKEYLLGFLSRGHGSSRTVGRDLTNYESVTCHSNFVIHSSDNQDNLIDDRKYWLSDCKYKRPLLQSSDAHALDKIGTKFSWIKSDLSFDGLRQIQFEPEERISLSKSKPETKPDYQVIDYIEYNGEKQYLSSNLNTLIGGRSTGKSTFLNSIARATSNDIFNKIVRENSQKLHVFDDEICVHWQNQSTENVSERQVEFIPQEYMIALAYNKKERNQLVDRIIESKDQRQVLNDYDESVNELNQILKVKVAEYIQTKQKYDNLLKPEGDESGVKNQIRTYESQKIEILKNGGMSDEENKCYKNTLKIVNDLKMQISKINQKVDLLKTLQSESLINTNIDLSGFDESEKSKILEIIMALKKKVDDGWKEKTNNLIFPLIETRSNNTNSLKEKEQSEIIVKGRNFTKSNKQLQELEKNIKIERENLQKFTEYKEKKEFLQKKVTQEQEQIIGGFKKYKIYRDFLQKKFNISANKLKICLEFSPVEFDKHILRGNVGSTVEFLDTFKKNPDDIIKNIFLKSNKDFSFNGGNDLNDLIQILFGQVWFTYDFRIFYEKIDFSTMSQGKKSFVILTLLLEFSEDKKPVLIDQPEDSLDNRAIYHQLTRYLKNKKKERQIILVTHNPNVVVGADAENIIVANQTAPEPNSKFAYINGGLENSKKLDPNESDVLKKQGIREHVIEILEGGLDAIEKREQKYNLI